MDNKQVEDIVVTDSSPRTWRVLIRQHSEKISILAEDVVLPKNKRLLRQASRTEDVSMGNIEAQYTQRSTGTMHTHQKDASRHFPIFTITISLIQVTLYYAFDRDSMLLLFGYDPHRRHEIWRFFTMMLVHLSPSHLWNNVVMQLLCGACLEIVHNWNRIAIIYFASVLGGSLFVSVLDNGYTVGASGGVFGLIFAHFATIALNWNEMERKLCLLYSLITYIIYDTSLTLYNKLVLKKNSHISHAAHFGGAVTGFLVSILVLKNFKVSKWEKKMQAICIGILTAIFGTVILVNIIVSGRYVPVEWNLDYSHTYLKDYLDEVKKSSKLTQQCDELDGCKPLLDQYNFNGTIPI